jgi:acetate kinase
MGSRTGDIDPAVAFLLARQAGLSLDDIDDLYHHHGGLRGLCGDNDMRAVTRRATSGDPDAQLALDVYCHRLRKYVGAYYAVLGRLDAIVFTAGIGEHSAEVRAQSLAGLHALGIAVDPARNDAGQPERVISPDDTPVTVCVVPTNEERAIAEQIAALLPCPISQGEHGTVARDQRPPLSGRTAAAPRRGPADAESTHSVGAKESHDEHASP